ncbi:MAG TPA: alpha/beta hydrolase-fold protein [Terriglobales bacterium]|jgi:predicted alpha/beta superfamily hydrolase|nr:alpha/beta hydrolase-fold protein [Terriglobales bacterium]
MEETVHPQVAPPNESVTGDLRLHEFHSRVFRNTRMLRVWLPPRYDAPGNAARRYPVLYLNDGQNLFDRATAFAGAEWQVDETADRLIRQEVIPPLIVVGVDNAQNDRIKEFLPYRSFHPPVLRPQGKRYPTFLVDEVMPFVAERYRIAPGPENTGLGGSSLGALISLYTVITRPGVFDHLLLESPSLFISNRRILKNARHFRKWPAKVFLAIGTREAGRDDKDRQVVEDVRELDRSLRGAGLDERRLLVKIDEGASHNEAEWAKRFPEALSFLFGTGTS